MDRSVSLKKALFYLYFLIMFGARAIGLYEGQLLYNACLAGGILLFVMMSAVSEYRVYEWGLQGALLLIAALVYLKTGEKGLLLYFTLFLGMKYISVPTLEKFGALVLGIPFVLMTVLSSFGVVSESIKYMNRPFVGRAARHTLGYPHPNTLMTTYNILIMLVLLSAGTLDEKKKRALAFWIVANAFILYAFCYSNTGLVISLLLVVLYFYFDKRKAFSVIEKAAMVLCYPVLCVAAIAVPIMVEGTPFYRILDKLMHTRIKLSLYYLHNEPITLFGTRFKDMVDPGSDYHYMIDNSFLYSFIQIGIIPFVIVTALSIYMIVTYVREERRTELAVIFSLCILGISDPLLYNLSYKNLMFIFIGDVFWRLMDKVSREGTWYSKKIRIVPVGLLQGMDDQLSRFDIEMRIEKIFKVFRNFLFRNIESSAKIFAIIAVILSVVCIGLYVAGIIQPDASGMISEDLGNLMKTLFYCSVLVVVGNNLMRRNNSNIA